jgi:hypothetical protein
MAIEQVKHSNLTSHSPGFTPAGATSYGIDVQGVIVGDGVELQTLQGGLPVSLDPPLRWLPNDIGGSRQTGLIPAGTVLRWFVPPGNNITTKVTSSHN